MEIRGEEESGWKMQCTKCGVLSEYMPEKVRNEKREKAEEPREGWDDDSRGPAHVTNSVTCPPGRYS